MKKSLLGVALFALLLAIPFAACVKDEPAPQPDSRVAPGWWIGLYKEFNSCRPARSICIRPGGEPYLNMLNVRLDPDYLAALPVAKKDGSLEVKGDISTDNLSEEARVGLLERRTLFLQEDVVLGEDLLRTAYENGGLRYNGEQLVIKKGNYAVDVQGKEETLPSKITITITITKDGITITIRW